MAFYLQSVSTGLFVDIKEGDQGQGARVALRPVSGSLSQQWEYIQGNLVNRDNKFLMDISGGGSTGDIILWIPTGGENQRWLFDQDFTIRCGLGTVLDASSGSTLVAATKTASDAQKFRVAPVLQP
ncbi:uncharacterized protein [Periplaneta americana]|uniref:uncharacterized protein n=1 Tax=Periplaneta americana TaxID=6978 RepID=UPI0037E75458